MTNNDEYLKVFLEPVIKEVARILVSGGVLALNVDDHGGKGVVLCKHTLEFAKNHGLKLIGTAGLRKGSGMGRGLDRDVGTIAEPIYMFHKP